MSGEKAAIYCRLSEEDKNKSNPLDDSESILNQKTMLVSYANERGWEIFGVYSDDDYAGADRSRPEFNRLIRDAEQRKFNIVLCKTQSRFTRELELVEKYIHGLFMEWGIRFVSIVDNADTENRGNKKSRQINGLVNEWYLEDMSENIKSVLDSRRRNGYHIGSFALYGYVKDVSRRGRLLVDREAAEVVKKVFTLYAGGMGKTAIARLLNNRGIPNPTEYKRRKGLLYKPPPAKSGTLWKYDTITKMLKNEMYIGNMVQGRYGSASYKTKLNKPRPESDWIKVENTHEAIISEDLWNKVQQMLKSRSRPYKGGEIGAFAGKAFCMNCGSRLCSTKTGDRRYLCCSRRYVSESGCEGAFIWEKRLEKAVLEQLADICGRYLDKKLLGEKIGGVSLADRKNRLLAEKSDCEKAVESFSRAAAALYLDRAKGEIDENAFSCVLERLKAERTAAEKRLENAENALTSEETSAADGKRLVDAYTAPEKVTRELADVFIERIEVGRRIKGSHDVPVTVYWKF